MAKTYNTIPTVSTGDVYAATAHNNIVTNVNNYRVPPMVRCTRSGALSYTGSSDVAWNAEDYDTDGMHDSVTNNARITPTTAGVYVITFSVHFTFSGTSTNFELKINKNGSQILTRLYDVTRTTLHKDAITLVDSANGTTDYYTAQFDMGGGTSFSVQANSTSYFAAHWLGQVS